MSRRIILRRQIPDDLRSIVDYMDQFSVSAADRFVEAVFSAFDDLAVMPGKGSPKQLRSSRLAGVRSLSVPGFRNHLIFYRQVTDGIDVLAVTHGSRRIRSLLLDRM